LIIIGYSQQFIFFVTYEWGYKLVLHYTRLERLARNTLAYCAHVLSYEENKYVPESVTKKKVLKD
jgi:hypothetical protein